MPRSLIDEFEPVLKRYFLPLALRLLLNREDVKVLSSYS